IKKEKDDLAVEIALCCYNKFNELSSRAKSSSDEWTPLATFLAVNENNQIDIAS
ncbi:unnamed protein product, partial [Rotaria magnacalcarata]